MAMFSSRRFRYCSTETGSSSSRSDCDCAEETMKEHCSSASVRLVSGLCDNVESTIVHSYCSMVINS